VEFVAAPGEITYDQTRVAHLSARSAGTVWKIFKRLGDEVKTGDIVALVDASEVGKTKSELLQAFATVQLKEQLLASIKDTAGAVPGVKVREAEAALREAEIRLNAARQSLVNLGLTLGLSEVQNVKAEDLEAKLHFLGIPAETTKPLDRKKITSNLLPVVAPMDGIITSREVVAGEATDTARILFEIVDTQFLWINFDVKGEDATRIKVGQPVRFKPDNGRAELTGKISWRSSQADLKTRTIRVRAELADPDRVQTANTFGSGKIILREEPLAVVVPNAAVHWEGCCHVVFVRDKDFLNEGSPKVFHTRTVRIGAKDDKNTEIIAGVLPGELVAVKNSGVLRAELLRGNLGEG
jgi:membrane fusion protein, heavy metal efflux system